MPQSITLDNMLANEGKGWFNAILSNCKWALSTQTPGDGVASSVLVTPSGTGECTLTTGNSQKPALVSTHKYYVSFKVKFESAVNGTFDWYWPVAEPAAASGMEVNAAAGVWTRVSATFDRTSFTDGNYQCRVDYNNDDGGNKPFRFTSCLLYDLTTAFGAGKEPSKEWMDTYVTAFADSQTVNYYENLGELFTDIANAIRTKDGTTGSIFACDFPERISATGGNIPDRVLIKCPNADGITTVQLDPNKNYYWEVSYAASDDTGGSSCGTIIDGVVAQDWRIGTTYGLFSEPPTYDPASGVLTLTKGYSTTYPSVTRIYGVPGSTK